MNIESIQNFLDNITNKYIKNKKDALEKFKTVKNNVKSKNLKDIVKELECAIFGYDYDDNEEPKYEESIADRTKMRRQTEKLIKKMHRELLPHQILMAMIQINLQKCIINFIVRLLMMKRLKKKQNRKKKYMRKAIIKKVMMVLGITSGRLIKMGLMKMGLMNMGLMKMGLIKMGLIKMGLIKMGSIKMEKNKKFSKWGYNINGFDRQGLNRDRYNINGYSNSGYDSQSYNINGYNHYCFARQGNKRKALKKNIPGSGLKILTVQQMLDCQYF